MKTLIAELTEEKKAMAIFMENFLILQDESFEHVSWNIFWRCKICLEAGGQYFQTLLWKVKMVSKFPAYADLVRKEAETVPELQL